MPIVLWSYNVSVYHQSCESEGVKGQLLLLLISHNHERFTLTSLNKSIPASLVCVRLCRGIIACYELSDASEADEMCGDSPLCCCQGKCQHAASHFTSQMKRDPFLVLPHASQDACLKPRLCCSNGFNEWPVLVLRVWATTVHCVSRLF